MNLLAEIEERGLMLIHDARVVSVTSMIAGEPVARLLVVSSAGAGDVPADHRG